MSWIVVGEEKESFEQQTLKQIAKNPTPAPHDWCCVRCALVGDRSIATP